MLSMKAYFMQRAKSTNKPILGYNGFRLSETNPYVLLGLKPITRDLMHHIRILGSGLELACLKKT